MAGWEEAAFIYVGKLRGRSGGGPRRARVLAQAAEIGGVGGRRASRLRGGVRRREAREAYLSHRLSQVVAQFLLGLGAFELREVTVEDLIGELCGASL